ncbi:MAG TPA: hypothetical protein VHV82_06915 [Sporichthyaceae bacterium]|jgi:hypothetical protein|nr:hypothetical protein [Sporichthyaceae bacterium]
MHSATPFSLSERWWLLSDNVEQMRAAGLTSAEIASFTGATPSQIDGVTRHTEHLRDELERAARGTGPQTP